MSSSVLKSVCMYKYKLVSDLEDALTCPICRDVAEDPWQHNLCGRLFCNSCFNKLEVGMPCPFCKRENPQYFQDGKSTREIRSLPLECEEVETGCQWKGTVSTLAEHLTTCGFVAVPCPNKCEKMKEKSEINSFLRKNLDNHLTSDCPNRRYKCEYCEEKGTYASITQVHDEICVKKILPCTNAHCFKTMQRQHLAAHVQFECEHTVIACKYQSIGCAKKMKRMYMAAHEQNDTLHLHMAINTISLLKEQCSVLSLVDGAYTTTFTLQEYEEKKRTNAEYCSPSFYTGRSGYHMRILVYANGNSDGQETYISIFVHILEGRHDKELKWPFVGHVKITLLNQERDSGHFTRTIPFRISDARKVKDNWGFSSYISHSELESQPYLKNDCLHFKVSVTVNDCKPWLE